MPWRPDEIFSVSAIWLLLEADLQPNARLRAPESRATSVYWQLLNEYYYLISHHCT